MACGIPQIVTDVGGNAEAVRDGIDGLVVDTRSPSSIAEALRRLLSNGLLRREMGVNARTRACDLYSLSRCASAYQSLYLSLVQRGEIPGPLVAS